MVSDDIVARLRRHADAGVPSYIKQLDTEAADEIVRLRKDWSIWKMTAEHLARELGKMEYAETTYDDVCRSVRGE